MGQERVCGAVGLMGEVTCRIQDGGQKDAWVVTGVAARQLLG